MESQKKTAILVVLGSILIIVAILAGGYIAYKNIQKKKDNSMAQDVSKATLVDTSSFSMGTSTDSTRAGWKIYTNFQYGFQFEYPADYKIDDSGISIRIIPSNLDFSALIEKVKKEYPQEVPAYSSPDIDEQLTEMASISIEPTNVSPNPFKYPQFVDTCLPFATTTIASRTASTLICDTDVKNPYHAYAYSGEIVDITSTQWQKLNLISFKLPFGVVPYADTLSNYKQIISSIKFSQTQQRLLNSADGWTTYKRDNLGFEYPVAWSDTGLEDGRVLAQILGYTPLVALTIESDHFNEGGSSINMSVDYSLDSDLQKALPMLQQLNPGVAKIYTDSTKTMFSANSNDIDCSVAFGPAPGCKIITINNQKWAFVNTSAAEADRLSAEFVTYKDGKWLTITFSNLIANYDKTHNTSAQKTKDDQYNRDVKRVMNSVVI